MDCKGWRQEKRLIDIAPDTELEVVCRKCKKSRYEWPRELIGQGRLGHLFIEELQEVLCCLDKYCRGSVRIQQMHDHLLEGFPGGMP